uniref:Uncharacterized protein n=1 Tax=Anopheles stephensi TaxID=30069 RepID=A0A182YRB0_ANOST
MPNEEEQKPSTSGMMKVNLAMSMFGHMEPFVIGENFDEYVSCLQQYFIVIDVEETKKVPIRCQQYEYNADGCTRNDGSGD